MGFELDQFTTGYSDALRDSLPAGQREAPFADETLQRIAGDCARRIMRYPYPEGAREDYQLGRDFSENRQEGRYSRAFPPLSPYRGDDGLVYLREAPASLPGRMGQ